MTRTTAVRALAAVAALLHGQASAQPARLPALNADIAQTTVSGLSSGGYMAVQLHVAHSASVRGAGIIAGGPYFCARDDQTAATTVCSCTGLGACRPDDAAALVPELVRATERNAQAGRIDPVAGLQAARVWLFTGRIDSTVPPPVMRALDAYYRNWVPAANAKLVDSVNAEHAQPTVDFGSACTFRGEPFINDCDFDAAGELLQWILGPLKPPQAGALGGRFIEFDQAEFIADPAARGMWPSGWAYVPRACEAGTRCRVHVAFHGCRQYPGASWAGGPGGRFGDTFVRNAGYNRWADANDIVLLYPQANAQTRGTRLPRINPNGCWDWWGYDDAAYATKQGRQVAAVWKMVERLAAASAPPPPPPPPGFCGRASNAQHAAAGRATSWFGFWFFARGSGDYLGLSGATETTLREGPAGSFRRVTAC